MCLKGPCAPLGIPLIRWPGGCFVSAYHWQDGVGKRTPVFDKAWRVEEPNTFGTDEFIRFCQKLNTEPYLCGNAGTGSSEEMSNWVEYCNLASAGRWAKERIANGFTTPQRRQGSEYRATGIMDIGSCRSQGRCVSSPGRYVTENDR